MKHLTLKAKLITGTLMVSAIIVALLSGCGSSSESTPAMPITVSPTPKVTSNHILQSPTSTNSPATPRVSRDNALSIAFDKQTVIAGEDFTINVMIKTTTPARSAQCVLSFDPSAMEYKSVTEGSLFSDWAANHNMETLLVPQKPRFDNMKGTVDKIGVAVMGATDVPFGQSQPGVQGQGVLLSYHMTVKAGVNKRAIITLSDIIIGDTKDQAIKDVETSITGQITIGTP